MASARAMGLTDELTGPSVHGRTWSCSCHRPHPWQHFSTRVKCRMTLPLTLSVHMPLAYLSHAHANGRSLDLLLKPSCAFVSLTEKFVDRTYGSDTWALVLHKLGLTHQWSEAWLATSPNPDRLMIE